MEYHGRKAQDLSTLNRYAFIDWRLSEDLEDYMALPRDEYLKEKARKQANGTWKEIDIALGGMFTHREWLNVVRAYRKAIGPADNRVVDQELSPRTTKYGRKLLELGVGAQHIVEMLIYQGMKPDNREKITPADLRDRFLEGPAA